MDTIKTINTQTPATKNQISNLKPNVIKNANVLQGYIANSINGGHIKPVAYAPVMAGTPVYDYKLRMNIKMLTPKTPAYQKLKAVFKCYWVPNTAVWDGYEKFVAQKATNTDEKVLEEPNLSGTDLHFISTTLGEDTAEIIITDTDLWRDSWVSTYIPRYQSGAVSTIAYPTLPKAQVLTIRGFKKIWNDFERNKEYDFKFNEEKGNTFTNVEKTQSIPGYQEPNNDYNYITLRGKRQNSYYTDYRTNLLGEDLEFSTTEPTTNTVLNYAEAEKAIAEARSQAENAQLNDWDILAKLYGAQKLSDNKVQLLGTRTVGLNYIPVTQSAYNVNNDIEQAFQELGQQGAYSYTEIDLSMIDKYFETKVDGYLHIVMQVTSDTIFETAFDRTNLNVTWDSKYRPDLKELKEDVLYNIEKSGTRITRAEDLTKITGFKRKFSEYFKLPNAISGDLCTRGYYLTTNMQIDKQDNGVDLVQTESKRSFQFFEQDDKETPQFLPKNIWQDYTDIIINENQASMQEVELIPQDNFPYKQIRIKGENQVFFIGQQTLIADLPIDENIKNNYTTWGEV